MGRGAQLRGCSLRQRGCPAALPAPARQRGKALPDGGLCVAPERRGVAAVFQEELSVN